MAGYEDRASILQGAGDMIFKLMLERSTPEQWAEWLSAPLEHAAGTANYELVKKLLNAGADGSAGWKGCHGKTLLHAAAEGGSVQVVNALIKTGAGADINSRTTHNGCTPLHLAVLSRKEAAAKMLIMVGAEVNILNAEKDAPLHLAIKGGLAEVAKDLLLSGADHTAVGSKRNYPLHLAARGGQYEVVQALLHRGANLHCRDSLLRTPLEVAVFEGNVSTVEFLLAEGADVNFRKFFFDNETTLHFAAEHNKAASIPALIEAGADIEGRDDDGETALFFAGRGSFEAMHALLQLGANPNTRNKLGRTPLHISCVNGEADTADLLLRWGADETIVDHDGYTPSEFIPNIDIAPEARPRVECLTELLERAPQDKAWRRRGFVVMCRAYQDRLRLAVEIPNTAAGAVEQQPRQRSSRRARRGRAANEVQVGGAHGARGGRGGGSISSSSSVGTRRRKAGDEGVGGGFDGVAAWLMGLGDDNVFRNIVGFL